LITSAEFTGFDFANTFKAYLEDELTGINDLISRIKNDECRKIFKRKHANLLEELAYSENLSQTLLDTEFWAKDFELENSIFNVLVDEGEDKGNIKIKIFSGMQVTVTEDDVLVLPKTITYLALTSIFSKKQDDRITLVMKLLKNISDEVTYKEIYFLLVLFDVIDLVKNTSNELIGHIEKYLEKYPYDSSVITKRKEQVLNSPNKEYLYVFTLEDYEKKLLDTLKILNIDFGENSENKIFINSFYFSGLTTVVNSLTTLTNN
jgi:rubrerythrin